MITSNYNYKYYTRQSQHDLPLPPSTSASGHRQVLYQASKFWNRLPKNVREIEMINCFKTKVKEHLRLRYDLFSVL